MEDGKSPGDDMVADLLEDAHPVVGHADAGIDRVEVEQAHAETRRETNKGNTGEEKKAAKSWIGHGMIFV